MRVGFRGSKRSLKKTVFKFMFRLCRNRRNRKLKHGFRTFPKLSARLMQIHILSGIVSVAKQFSVIWKVCPPTPPAGGGVFFPRRVSVLNFHHLSLFFGVFAQKKFFGGFFFSPFFFSFFFKKPPPKKKPPPLFFLGAGKL